MATRWSLDGSLRRQATERPRARRGRAARRGVDDRPPGRIRGRGGRRRAPLPPVRRDERGLDSSRRASWPAAHHAGRGRPRPVSSARSRTPVVPPRRPRAPIGRGDRCRTSSSAPERSPPGSARRSAPQHLRALQGDRLHRARDAGHHGRRRRGPASGLDTPGTPAPARGCELLQLTQPGTSDTPAPCVTSGRLDRRGAHARSGRRPRVSRRRTPR